jgi:CRISPR/Cas system CMR-associated protein Cmr3 (group 5 of RAMP superfamily)
LIAEAKKQVKNKVTDSYLKNYCVTPAIIPVAFIFRQQIKTATTGRVAVFPIITLTSR